MTMKQAKRRVASNAIRAELHKSLLVGSAPKPLFASASAVIVQAILRFSWHQVETEMMMIVVFIF